ncbi:S1C family serine protease [Lacticigenium naphthae]|uniref:S1C family serine protease n=1 Tax=Lacticigenium naphthae TaxID=515351 RepID=UPI00041D37D6|nr:trypsin-like peptidase domain-containing protein [Lacticigenium naphthae]
MKNWKQFLKAMLTLSTVSIVIAGCGLSDSGPESDSSTTKSNNQPTEISKMRVDVSSGITDAVEIVDEAVVSVINLQQVDYSEWGLGGMDAEEEEDLQQAGTGSGVIYKTSGEKGYVVTNYHVVQDSDGIDILFKDGSRESAKVIGSDEWTDLAVLEISTENISMVAEFGDSENLTVGEPAIAIGSPLGTDFASSVTAGIISATERTVPVDTDQDNQADWEMTAIQTDAAINPGNSGGALINIAGQVVGINSMKISTDTVEGMGFAIPANDVVDIVNQLEESGEVIRPVLGISLIDVSMISEQQQESVLNLPEDLDGGVVVQQVNEGSAADVAGMQRYDVIVEYNGVKVTNSIELRKEIYKTEVGEEVEVKYYRGGELETTRLILTTSDTMI